MKIKPINDQIVVKQKEQAEKSSGGIILSPAHTDAPNEGECLCVGNGFYTSDGTLIPLEVKNGDKIIFQKNSGVKVKVDGEEYLIIRQSNVLAVYL